MLMLMRAGQLELVHGAEAEVLDAEMMRSQVEVAAANVMDGDAELVEQRADMTCWRRRRGRFGRRGGGVDDDVDARRRTETGRWPRTTGTMTRGRAHGR